MQRWEEDDAPDPAEGGMEDRTTYPSDPDTQTMQMEKEEPRTLK